MIKPLAAYRARIDNIDTQVCKLLQERFAITGEIGQHKKNHGLAVLDEGREQAIAKKFEVQLARSSQKDYIWPILQSILTESKRQQMELRVTKE
jgi:chorismate mutase